MKLPSIRTSIVIGILLFFVILGTTVVGTAFKASAPQTPDPRFARCNDPNPNKAMNFHSTFFEYYQPIGTESGHHPYEATPSWSPWEEETRNTFRNLWLYVGANINGGASGTGEAWDNSPEHIAGFDHPMMHGDTYLTGLQKGGSFIYTAKYLRYQMRYEKDEAAGLGYIYDWDENESGDDCSGYFLVFDYDPSIIAVDRIVGAQNGTPVWWKKGQMAIYMKRPYQCDWGSCHLPMWPFDAVRIQGRLIGDPHAAKVRPFKVTDLNAHIMAKAPTGTTGNAVGHAQCTNGNYGIQWCMQAGLDVHWNETAVNSNVSQSVWPSSGEIIAQLKTTFEPLTSLLGYTIHLKSNGFVSNPETNETLFLTGMANFGSGISQPWENILAENRRIIRYGSNIVGLILAEKLHVSLTKEDEALPQENGLNLTTNPNITIRSEGGEYTGRSQDPFDVVDGGRTTARMSQAEFSQYVATLMHAKGAATIAIHPTTQAYAGRFTTPIKDRNLPAWTGTLVWNDDVNLQNGYLDSLIQMIDTLTGPHGRIMSTLEEYITNLESYGGSVENFTVTPGTLDPNPTASGITVGSTSYGANCPSVPTGNMTAKVAAACNGQASCVFPIDVAVLGDPAPGCAKTFETTWTCGVDPTVQTATVEKEAHGKSVTLTCGTPPPPTSALPTGTHDLSTCTESAGWTCDADDYTHALKVHVYDGPYGVAGSVFLGETLANLPREAGVATACGGQANHGFSFPTPASLQDGQAHQLYAYAINLDSAGTNPLLLGSPRTIQCGTPPPTTATLDCAASTFTATATSLPANGTSTTTLSVSANDATGAAIANLPVTFNFFPGLALGTLAPLTTTTTTAGLGTTTLTAPTESGTTVVHATYGSCGKNVFVNFTE